MRTLPLAAAAALVLLPGAVLAAPAEEVFAQAVVSCLSRHTKGAVPEVLPAGQVVAADPANDPLIAKVHGEHGPTLKVAADSGGVYITEEDVRCEVRGFDLDPVAAAEATERLLMAKPYKAQSPLGKIIVGDGMILGGLVARTRRGQMMISIGRLKMDAPRTLFATVKNF